MINNKKRTYRSGTRRADSVYYRTAVRRRWLLSASVFLAVLLLTAGFGCMRADAGTSKEKTKTIVITTDSDEQFAAESAKLAKKSRGMMVQNTGKAKAYSSGRLIVCLEDGKSVDFSRYKATTVIESNFGVCLVQFSSGSAAKKAAKKIAALPAVSFVEPDDCSVNIGDTKTSQISLEGSTPEGSSGGSGSSKPEITAIGEESTAKRDPGITGDLVYQDTVKAEAASVSSNAMSWGAAYVQADKYAAFVKAHTKRSIKVAVIDSGVSYHKKLKGRILAGKDYVDNDSNPSDKNGHGTHVAGVIVDCTPGINVKILPVRVMNAYGNGNPSAVGNAIRYAVKKGAKVINLSLGAYQHYKYIENCISYANKKGVTVVVAAGNECTNTRYVCPAHMSAPIVVGAINSNGKRASFSNYGASLDISAPGVNIRSCWLKGKYATASGTSMAVPHISAVAAMYRLMNPSANASRTQYLVRCYAKDLGAKGTDKYYGRGVPRMAASITPSKVTLPQKAISVQVKSSVTLKARIIPSYAGKKKLTWTSSNKKVATVTGGKILAKGKGTTTITVKTVNGKKATCKVTVTAAPAKAASARKTQTTAAKTVAARIAPVEPVRTEESVPAAAAAAAQEVRIYIYPSDQAGNAPVQDGSIVAGSRLALDAEIVPVQGDPAPLHWSSSAPETASVDENGIVTAVSAGEAQITAALSSEEGSPAATSRITVVEPSVLTRRASYDAEEDREVNIEAVLRVPASLDENAAEEAADRINPRQEYVLAALYKEDKDLTLLGAVNLGGADSGTIHVHDPENGGKRTDLREIEQVTENTLADLSSGKRESETGILSLRSIDPDGCKADVTLTANLDAIRSACGDGSAGPKELKDCVLAVYTGEAFEEREAAAEKKDAEAVRQIDENAVCMCSFGLSFTIPEKEGEDNADPAGSGAAPEPSGKESAAERDSKEAEPVETPESGSGSGSGSSSDPAEDTAAPAGEDKTAEAAEEIPDEPAQTDPEITEEETTEEEGAEEEGAEEENEASVPEEEKDQLEGGSVQQSAQENPVGGPEPSVTADTGENAAREE